MNKYLKYAAAAIFVATLAINIAVTLDDPFVLLSNAMADETTTTTTTTATGGFYKTATHSNYTKYQVKIVDGVKLVRSKTVNITEYKGTGELWCVPVNIESGWSDWYVQPDDTL